MRNQYITRGLEGMLEEPAGNEQKTETGEQTVMGLKAKAPTTTSERANVKQIEICITKNETRDRANGRTTRSPPNAWEVMMYRSG